MENQEEISIDPSSFCSTSIQEIDDLSATLSDDDETHPCLSSVNTSLETSHSVDVNSISRSSNAGEGQCRVDIPSDGLNQEHQRKGNLEPNTIEIQSTITSKSDSGATKRYVAPHLRNRPNITLDINQDVVKHEYIHPTGLGSTMSRNISYNHGASSYGAIKRKVELSNQGKTRGHLDKGSRQNTGIYVDRRNSVNVKFLDDLLKLDAEKFTLKIFQNMSGLNNFVDEINLSDDAYVILIRVLKRIFDLHSFDLQRIVLQTILNERFINNLQKYLGSLPMYDKDQKSQNEFFWQNANAFWTDLIEVSRKALEMLPNYASNILPKVVLGLQICIPIFEQHQNQHVPDEVKIKLNELVKILEVTELRFKNDDVDVKPKKKSKFENDEPPDDFRTISVYPDRSEILGECSFLRPNVVDGPYRDVEHYLDVQFRLLREDFVNPLRCGVRSILSGENVRHENVQVHKRIRFLHQEAVNDNYCVRIKFSSIREVSNFCNGDSKKFMFGSLVCFTRDNFETLDFARVVKRDIGDLIKGELIVGFDTDEPYLSFNQDYLMIECNVYFEPYFHVLTALKNIYKNDLAMTKYIVDVRPDCVPPQYLNRRELYGIDGRRFGIHDLADTTKHLYGFNNSQMNAFKAALTNEFAIIQGPPGTGKTFLALIIAKTLLSNCAALSSSTPMLIICFTNHALDQFLEGLLDTTDEIVRIGGQSKNESLANYNLTVLRRLKRLELRMEMEEKGNKYFSDRLDCRRFAVNNSRRDVRYVNQIIEEIEQYDGIVTSLHFLRTVPGFNKTYFSTADRKNFTEWLVESCQDLSLRKEFNRIHTNKIHQCSHESMLSSCTECHESVFEVTLYDIQKTIYRKQRELALLEYDLQVTALSIFFGGYPYEEINNTKKSILALEQQYEYLERRLADVKAAIQNQQIRIDIDTEDLDSLSYDDRWALYTFWLYRYRLRMQRRAPVLMQQFQKSYKYYEEEQNLEDIRLLQEKSVVGMTTTSAARLRPVLKRLRCPIIIVEEAAEILEAHIITALTEHCQHLILIGDHKQLKPSSADHKITKDYKLGISLFERMVNNGIQCHTLNVQHRMRPEISKLICPTIYPDLKDHKSVFDRPPITGIESTIRFIDHKHLEDDCGDNLTKKNLHEVKFCVGLARYLVLNGYKPEQVTILTAYLGQMFAMLNERYQYIDILGNMRIAALDNYQGEQSDIIILSMVRSNRAKQIGFLAEENRVCVALSRARNGLYIIGNMELLSRNSKLWKEVKGSLEAQNAIGPDLTLRCQIHTDTTTIVSKGEDFQLAFHGGCNQICKARLVCGHSCRLVCHLQNREHEKYQCLERCDKSLCDKNENHTCAKMCYEECGPCTHKVSQILDCGHEILLECHIDVDDYKCPVLIPTTLPCDHIAGKPCHVDADTLECQVPCEVMIESCGHYCTRNCHNSNDPDHNEYECKRICARPRVGCSMTTESAKHACPKLCYESCPPCDILVKKQRNKCPHINEVACSEDVDSLECMKPCTRRLSCTHKCKKKCDEPCESASCTMKVKKVLKICGHKVRTLCNEEPKRNRCNKRCPLKLPCGHFCTKRCNQVCTPCCEVLVDVQGEAANDSSSIVQMKCHDLTSEKKI